MFLLSKGLYGSAGADRKRLASVRDAAVEGLTLLCTFMHLCCRRSRWDGSAGLQSRARTGGAARVPTEGWGGGARAEPAAFNGLTGL